MRTLIVILLIVTCTAQVVISTDYSFARLAKVEIFAFGPTGFGGKISQGEKDYRSILLGPSPNEKFERLFEMGNPQAKCYALVGIRILDPIRSQELSVHLLSDKTNVVTQSGCVVLHDDIGTVVKRIDEGYYK